jgi:DNA-binding transcriptional LysR family regulator
MEMFELRYFLGVAREENVSRAAERLAVSPASLSKAIARLETELGVSLFSREGRNIRLTSHGRLFQKRAAEIVHLEESTKLEIAGHKGAIHVVIAGPEVLLSEMGLRVSQEMRRKYPAMTFEFSASHDEEAIGKVTRGEAHLAIVSSDIPDHLDLSEKILAEPMFMTVVGKGHALHGFARSKKVVPVEKILEHSFVIPSLPLLGKVGMKQTLDGWRDDQFPRKFAFLTSSLKLLEELVMQGQALAYVPDYFAKRIGAEVLKIAGCPYSCKQKIRLLAKNPQERSWLAPWFA